MYLNIYINIKILKKKRPRFLREKTEVTWERLVGIKGMRKWYNYILILKIIS